MTNEIILNRCFGDPLPRAKHLTVEFEDEYSFAAGTAVLESMILIAEYEKTVMRIPVTTTIPTAEGKHPTFIHITDLCHVPNMHQPTEELIELGFAVVTVHVGGEAMNNIPRGKRGTISVWASMASLALDYVCSLDSTDKERIAVIGHEQYGTAALLCAARDDRVKFAICNGSGMHINKRVSIRTIMPTLFSDGESTSDTLIREILPRRVMLGTSESDPFASPTDTRTLIKEVFGDVTLEECCGVMCARTDKLHYHCRSGGGYLSRRDWKLYAEYILNT